MERHEIELHDLESMNSEASANATDLSKVTLEGDDVPEAFRGKSAIEVARQAAALQESLKVSEHARLALQNSSQALSEVRGSAPTPAPIATPARDEIDSMTDEQLRELYDKDAFKAQQIMIEKSNRALRSSFEARVGSLAASGASTAEREARSRFAEDFQVLGPEIQKLVDSVPDKGVLSNPGAWENMIAYVRGQNIDKVIEHRTTKARVEEERKLADTRAREANNAPANFTNNGQPPAARGKLGELDATQKEIARTLGISEQDYRNNWI